MVEIEELDLGGGMDIHGRPVKIYTISPGAEKKLIYEGYGLAIADLKQWVEIYVEEIGK